MDRAAVASRGLRWGCFSLAAVIGLLAVTVDPADARSRRKRAIKKTHHAQVYRPPYSAIVVDAKTGATLHQESADAVRHPASLTKIMTLYLLFEQLEAGKLKLDTAMEVSAEAGSQAPTKLGVRPGETLTVEDAIKGLITKSANDAAVVVAEALAGSEAEFARRMTRQARLLGMNRTVYRNASGLPDDEQVTTARDQALLGVAIQERFPGYYRYFSTASFVYRGRAMRNHNRLLGRVHGVDGIKTGYTRASGFNLTASVRRGNRHVVAVLLGGRSGPQRDARMRELIAGKIMLASAKPAVRTAVAETAATAWTPLPLPQPGLTEQAEKSDAAAQPQLASAVTAPQTEAAPVTDATATIPPSAGSSAPIKPISVRTYSVKLVPPTGSAANQDAVGKPVAAAPVRVAAATPVAVSKAVASTDSVAVAPKLPRGTWVIQIGAFEDESEAKERLTSAQSKAGRLLSKASRYTERTTKGEKIYYRARFAGFDRDGAQQACRQLKRSDIDCMALKI
jgi:D-alanyl-D-alanine carboxypeptidase